MEDKVNFSVLMSLYFKENPEYLNMCLLSLHQQSLQATEIVIVLDGEVGCDLHLVLDSWKDILPIKIYPLDANVGLGKALNYGLYKCSYNIVARMDTDDICKSIRFSTQVPLFYNDKNLALVASAIQEFEGDVEHKKGIRFSYTCESDVREYAKKRNPFNHMSVVYRRDVILSLGGYVHHLYMEDYNLWLRLLSSDAKCINIPEVLMDVRGGENLLARRSGFEYVKSEWQLLSLKKELRYDSLLNSYIVFILRSTPRLLPKKMLAIIYRGLRRKTAENIHH